MKRLIITAACLLLAFTGCRQESDNVLSYAFNDDMAFSEAEKSYAGKFDVLWRGLNANYAMWDFERAYGLDWDAVYDKYYPKFAELDAVDTLVSDNQLKALLQEVAAPLHDGHLTLQMKNHVTGKYVSANPNAMRVFNERHDELVFALTFIPTLKYYVEAGEVLEGKSASSEQFENVIRQTATFLQSEIARIAMLPDPTPEDQELAAFYQQLVLEIAKAYAKKASESDTDAAVQMLNELALRYEYMHIPGLTTVDKNLCEYPINITYALFKGNIAYLRIDHFTLTAFVAEEYLDELFPNASESTLAIIKDVRETWEAWFNAIQKHTTAGDLGGVIIDVRSNGGGFVNDFQYVLGALLPSGQHQVTNARFKRGTGRYDYSPIMPQYMQTLAAKHAVVKEPIVTLCNCYSVSMAEQTSLGTKQLDNGCLIGTRTWGGLSALSDNASYSHNYAGFVGEEGKTPVYGYIPTEVVFSLDGKILESTGITPDIYLPMDVDTWKATGKDNQLERALQLIRSK